MSEVETIIVAQDGSKLNRAFNTWEEARTWRRAVKGANYTLTEIIVDEIPPSMLNDPAVEEDD